MRVFQFQFGSTISWLSIDSAAEIDSNFHFHQLF